MKQYKLCKSCIHHQFLKPICNSFTLRTSYAYYEVCNKSLTPTIKNNQEHCPQYATNPNLRKTKRK